MVKTVTNDSIEPYQARKIAEKNAKISFIGILLVVCALNQYYCYEYFQSYFCLVFNNKGKKDGWLRFTRLGMMIFVTIFSLPMAKKFGAKAFYTVPVIILGLFYMVLPFLPKSNWLLFNILYGCFTGFAAGATSILPFYLIWAHADPAKKVAVASVFYYLTYTVSVRLVPSCLNKIWAKTWKLEFSNTHPFIDVTRRGELIYRS
jgi:Na+/melibiose symporter-like transporter